LRIEPEQIVMQAANHHLGEGNEVARLRVDRCQNLAASDDFFHAALTIFGKFVEDECFVLFKGRDTSIHRERGVHPFHLCIGEQRVLDPC